MSALPIHFEELKRKFTGDLYYLDSGEDNAQRILYSTDASVYQEKPLAVTLPKTIDDIKALVRFAQKHQTTLVPRTGGTSLAGQVVGNGIVVDVSKYFNQIIEINAQEKWVRVQPGFVRDDLNVHLRKYGLMFGPETSTSSRAMIGGMVGNNSSGLHSPSWGVTRDHVLEIKAVLSDATEAHFKPLTLSEFEQKCLNTKGKPTLEQEIYAQTFNLLQSPRYQENIRREFPKKSIARRNTGYALDALIDMEPFMEGGKPFNFCKLLAGSEGTLCFSTEIKLNLLDLPPKEVGLLCIHCHNLIESLKANTIAMRYKPYASELVDKIILDFTRQHTEYRKNLSVIVGDPKAVLMVEFFAETRAEIEQKAAEVVAELKLAELGYAYPLLFDDDIKKAWDVRKGGLGVLRNQPGDYQPVNLIEDCAVAVEDLPFYIIDLQRILAKHGLEASYYAHAGAGELHVEPMMNLKTQSGKDLFRQVLKETAELVKKYKGSLSGEHGDGRLRGEFIQYMVGGETFQLFREIKRAWDPNKVFNAGKVVDTPPMNEFLRFQVGQKIPKIETIFDFSKQEGILRLAEKCSGSGDCRKTELTGGTMCPSYMATRRERDTTRGRANILRQFLSMPVASDKPEERFNHPEIKEVMDLCLSCKGCKTECPSSVDMAKLKAEFLQHYYDANKIPFRTKLVGNFTKMSELAAKIPWAYNFVVGNALTAGIAKSVMGFALKRSMPKLFKTTLRKWYEKEREQEGWFRTDNPKRRILLFCDEFTNYNDVEIGIKTIKLFQRLGYEVVIPEHLESGRTYLSKGLVRDARQIAIENVKMLSKAIESGSALVGIEPSAILGFRDEYLDLVPQTLRPLAEYLSENAYLFDEYIAQEIDKKNIRKEQFTTEKRLIKLHGHCHQKALSSLTRTKKALTLPENYEVHLIPSGCCGMAGSFGYEKEHYDVSMQIGELVLFPTVRQQPEEVIIAAPGTSCRHQIKDGTGRIAKHPAEILFEALV